MKKYLIAILAVIVAVCGFVAASAFGATAPTAAVSCGSASASPVSTAVNGNVTVHLGADCVYPAPAAVTVTTTKAGPTVTKTVTATPSASASSSSSSASATPTPSPSTSSSSNPVPGAFPNASNTGVPAGTVLTKRGDLTVTAPNTVIQNTEIDGCLTIAASAGNVTVKDSLIKSNGCIWNIDDTAGAPGLIVTDTEIDGLGNTTGDAGIHGYGYTLTRVNIHGTGDGAKVGDGDVIQDSYIHDLAITSDSHNDGIQSLDTNGLTIRHNTIIVKDGGTSAIILSTGSGDQKNISITGNLLAGGAFTVYGGYEQGVDVLSRVSNIQITGNEFSTQVFANSGAFGPVTSDDSPVVFTGNTWADGPKAGQPVAG